MGHTYASLFVHVIFSTKERRPLIRDDMRERLFEYMCGIGRGEFGKVLCVGGTANHVHGLVSLDTTIAIADAMRVWKAGSSGWVNKTFALDEPFGWQSGYGAFSVSKSATDEVIAYIRNQEEHHRHRTFEHEFLAFLERHGIEYDPRYVWD
jgi:putative transposase